MESVHDNLILKNTLKSCTYTAPKKGSGADNLKTRDRIAHGQNILRQLSALWEENDRRKEMFSTIKDREGTYLEFHGADNCDLITSSLENASKGIRLLNVREIHANDIAVEAATVFVPSGKENYFSSKVEDYLCKETAKGLPANRKLIESIETVRLAVITSFWTGNACDIPDETKVWCEYWLRMQSPEPGAASNEFFAVCNRLGIEHKLQMIHFPGTVVVMARTNRNDIQQLIDSLSIIEEIRRSPEANEFFTKMDRKEAELWLDDVKAHITGSRGTSYICLLDTGINSLHPLLKDLITDDHIHHVSGIVRKDDIVGHGTMMAGVCEYFDVMSAMTAQTAININHDLESVKILPDSSSNQAPELYGAITADAASLSEIYNPNAKRIYCMAVTADPAFAVNDGSPSSWSGALDSIISGAEDGIRKLFVVSAGNVSLEELRKSGYCDANFNHSVESPGQAWNAVTVGAYSQRIEVQNPLFSGWMPVADNGELCPYSSTSLAWDDHKWPVKPEILMDGGNAITDGREFDSCDDLSILTTNKDIRMKPFTTIDGTSAATAQAAYMAAELRNRYPELWEETIRALMVHSAEWTDKMKRQFCYDEKKSGGIKNLLRCCGYGIASLERAQESHDNCVNMIIQAEIQPYRLGEGNVPKTNEMHLHMLPWPEDMLIGLGNTQVSMKITLSYYVEPAPDQKGWNNKYRYSSAGLRFDVIGRDESIDRFVKRINAAAREDGSEERYYAGADTKRWYLGKTNRDVGSVHSDVWTGPAVDLAESRYIAVYPVIGWWKERRSFNKLNDKMKYGLVVTLSTPEESVDFYTPIVTQIAQGVAIEL